MSFYVAPDGVVKLLKGVPCDMDYEHTLWFHSLASQTSYFETKVVRTFTSVTYVRKTRGIIKVEAPVDSIYDCNYLMYQNTGFNRKWFYAFIVSVEYVSNNVSKITFIIDDLQTWFFEMQLKQCFVEREHTDHDIAGDNLIPENLETGEYIYTNQYTPYQGYKVIVIAASFIFSPPTGGATYGTIQDLNSGYMYGGIYNGVWFHVYPFDDNGVTKANQLIATATRDHKIDGILSAFTAYSNFWEQSPEETDYFPHKESFVTISRPLTFDTYIPKNNKLFTEPYMSMLVKTPTNSAEFGYEYFKNPSTPTFKMTYSISTKPTILLEPVDYKSEKIYQGQQIVDNYLEGITLEGFPMLAYNVDSYKAWLAQNGASLMVNGALAVGGLIGSLASGITSGGMSEMLVPSIMGVGTPVGANYGSNITALSANPGAGYSNFNNGYNYVQTEQGASFNPSGTGVLGSLGAIGNILAQMYQHKTLPPQIRGNVDENSQFVSDRLNFYFCNKMITKEYAEIIDNYFSRYGYACHRIKIPNTHVRERWTFTKTVGCEVEGNIPNEAKNKIKSIFNNGITFWSDLENVGNYSLSNLILA